jgi:hypothetical protein
MLGAGSAGAAPVPALTGSLAAVPQADRNSMREVAAPTERMFTMDSDVWASEIGATIRPTAAQQ